LDGLFRYNQFSNLVEFARVPPWLKGTATDEDTVGRAITDTDIIRLRAYLATMKGYEIATQTLMDAVSEAAQRLTTHPVREWLNALTWDGKLRCNTWLTKYAGSEDSIYTAAVGRKFLCGAVSRIFWPGCKFDSMLVLEGPQNAGKSRLCKALGGKWFGDPVVDPHARDTIAALASKWIVELAEMEVTRRAEVAALKAFISRQEDRARLAYGRISQDYPRQCVFIGTINPETDGAYLKDTTGNRRFWPVAVGSRLDVEGLQEAREQLFAEAVFLVRGGEKLYLDTPELVAAATIEAQKRAIVSPWAEAIMQWLAVPDPATGKTRTDVTAREVYLGALSGRDEAMKRQHTLEIGATLQLLGYAPAWGSRNGLTARVFKKEG
jgi:predicted P-loop ATPase